MGHGKATALIFLLAQQVKEPKRLGLARDQTRQWTVCRGWSWRTNRCSSLSLTFVP